MSQEYRVLTRDEYRKYSNVAKKLISKICKFAGKGRVNLSTKDVIHYFESSYPIHFRFFDCDPISDFVEDDEEYPPAFGSAENILCPDLVKNQSFMYTDREFCSRCSGLTRPLNDRIVIFISQYEATVSRILFTILHELSHVYCHIKNDNVKEIFVSLADAEVEEGYPDEIQPFEDEANIVASHLFITDEYIEHAFSWGSTFREIKLEKNISEAALHNRLMNYAMYSIGLSRSSALSLVLDFRQGKEFASAKICHYIDLLKGIKQKL